MKKKGHIYEEKDERISIVIANTSKLFLESLHNVLSRNKNLKIVGEAKNSRQTIDQVGDLKPGVVLIEFSIAGMNDVNIISKIKEKSPETKTLMLLNSENEDMIFKALKAGARGYLYSNASISELIKAIKTVHKGDLWIERKFFTLFFEAEKGLKDEHDQTSDTALSRLTQREEEVLYCLTKSYTNKEIAKELSISEKTVKSHLNNIFRKLNVTGRLQAILYVINRGLKTDRD